VVMHLRLRAIDYHYRKPTEYGDDEILWLPEKDQQRAPHSWAMPNSHIRHLVRHD